MVEYSPDLYGESFADVYDDWYGQVSDVAATVSAIAAMSPGRQLLELGVGTGRIALELAAAGFEVTGIDASASMLDKLAERDPEGRIDAVEADMSSFDLGNDFDVALVAFNTLFNLTTVEAQQACFESVSNHLRDGSLFFVEAIVPSMESGRSLGAKHLADGGVVLTATITESRSGLTRGNHVHLDSNGATRLRPWAILPTRPHDLDLMAERAGLELIQRYGDWGRHPFDDESTTHVSIYQRTVREVQ